MATSVSAPVHHANAIAACAASVAACTAALDSFGGARPPAHLAHAAEVCRSCARITGIAIDELKVGSGFVKQTCALAGVIARACADECELHRGRVWADCAAACRHAAQECHAVAAPKARREA